MLPSKWEDLSCFSTKLIHVCKKLPFVLTEQKFSLNIQYTYVSILGVTFAVSFLYYFQKLQLLVIKNFELIFAAL